MKKNIAFLLLLFFANRVFATHNRAGEITYRCLGGLKYEVTITTYTKTSSVQADRPALDSVNWGDGYQSVFTRDHKTDLGNDISVNIYIQTHIYNGNGVYTISLEDPNRNSGVVNIPGSVDVPFYIETQLLINQSYGCNNSPVLNKPPIDQGCIGFPFIHNPAASDVDGDSLSYQLMYCKGAGGLDIPGYAYPFGSNGFTLNAVTGDLIWDSPDSAGEYNVAFKVIQWRRTGSGAMQNIGYVERDMQITIKTCTDNPPQVVERADTCVLAGDSLGFTITATDADSDLVTLSSFGGVYQIPDSATFSSTPAVGTATGTFSWNTTCNHISLQPYLVEFQASDNASPVSLVDMKGVFIYVIAPPPPNLTTVASGNSIILNWDISPCPQANGYKIYRRNGQYPGIIECPCETGAPSYTGYSLIGTTTLINSTTFTDNNNGAGLAIGIDYCYIVTATFPDGSESCASNQSCANLKKDLPVITNASVNTTAVTTGSMYVAWSAPSELDTVQYPGPYQYIIYHTSESNLSNFSPIGTLNNIGDTTIIDTLIDTDAKQWWYRVDFYYDSAGTSTLKGSSASASSVFLTLAPTDNAMNLSWGEHVPWSNYRFDIFRKHITDSGYDSIATTTGHTYTDGNLNNGVSQCYYIRSVGSYFTPGIADTLINLSQRECATPFDNVAPCPPQLTVTSNCVESTDELEWTKPDTSCGNDVMYYNIYYASDSSQAFTLIDTVSNANDLSRSISNLETLTGCFKVTAVDTSLNESTAAAVCVDTCRQYVLPSVFTPNGDGRNDLFHPCDETTSADLQAKNCPPYQNVKDVDMKIFNRWGNLVYETTNKDVNWNGKEQSSNSDCADGIYYYICTVNFIRLSGTEAKQLHGYVHLLRGK